MKKSAVRQWPTGSSEYVVLHAAWQRSRGRNPSAQFAGLPPRKSLRLCKSLANFSLYPRDVDLGAYQCAICRVSGVKLWRMGASSQVLLKCVGCVCRGEYVYLSTVDARGTVPCNDGYGRSDQIGSYVPAVPHPTGSYWGYTSVSTAGAAWWRALPLSSLGPKPGRCDDGGQDSG